MFFARGRKVTKLIVSDFKQIEPISKTTLPTVTVSERKKTETIEDTLSTDVLFADSSKNIGPDLKKI